MVLQRGGVVAHAARVVAGVRVLRRLRVDGLVARLRVQDQARRARRPGVRLPVLVPFYTVVAFGAAVKTLELGLDGIFAVTDLFSELHPGASPIKSVYKAVVDFGLGRRRQNQAYRSHENCECHLPGCQRYKLNLCGIR